MKRLIRQLFTMRDIIILFAGNIHMINKPPVLALVATTKPLKALVGCASHQNATLVALLQIHPSSLVVVILTIISHKKAICRWVNIESDLLLMPNYTEQLGMAIGDRCLQEANGVGWGGAGRKFSPTM